MTNVDVNAQALDGPRPCTCHPDDRPPVCHHRYATSECQMVEATQQRWLTASTTLRLLLERSGVTDPHSIVDAIEELIPALMGRIDD